MGFVAFGRGWPEHALCSMKKDQLSPVDLATQLVVCKATASSYLEARHKCRILGPTLDLLSHDLHRNKGPQEKHVLIKHVSETHGKTWVCRGAGLGFSG